MGKSTEQNIFPKQEGQMAKKHEEMLNIPLPERKCKSKPHSDSTSLLLEWLPSRTPPPPSVGEDMGKRNPDALLVGM
jgi:hypothetical protein